MQETITPPSLPPPLPDTGKIKPLHVLRDVLLTFGLSFAVGVVLGVVNAATHRSMSAIEVGLANLLSLFVGFTVAGCIARQNRWPHLLCMAGGLWLCSLVNLAFGLKFAQWMGAIVPILIAMGLGGGLATLIKPREE